MNTSSQAVISLGSRTLFSITGEEAVHWLGDLLTCSIPEVGNAVWWALLSPQGKVQADGLLYRAGDDDILLETDSCVAEAFFKRLKLYRLRSKVEIVVRDDRALGWSADAVEMADATCFADPRHETLGYYIIAPTSLASNWDNDHTDYDVTRLKNGIGIMGHDYGPDEMFPHDLGMDILGAIDFKKGCYVGQEVVSRMQHRGTARRRPVCIIRGPETSLGDDIMLGDRLVGHSGRSVDGHTVGYVRIDKITTEDQIQITGHAVQLALPEWASYAFSDSKSDLPD